MRHLLVLALVALAACSTWEPSEEPVLVGHRRSVAQARQGMVAASHPAAVEIGLQVLKDGGTAVDAAIAMNAALGVVEPHACGIGGDLFALVWDAKGRRLQGLNASGPAPRAARPATIDRDENGRIPRFGAHSWTVPGCVDGWATLHERFGRLSWSRLLEPSIRAAREGEPVPRVIASFWETEGPRHLGTPGFASTYFPEGRPLREGELFQNEALAQTYEKLARGGRDAFYEGEIAAAMAAFSAAHGGLLAREDLRDFRSQWVEPISTTYRDVELFELPPNGQGLAALQMLEILETRDLSAMDRNDPRLWHLMIEAKKLAFEDRARFIADPDQSEVPVAALLDADYLRRRAALIDPDRAALRLDAGDPRLERGDTTYLSVVDREGNMVSLIQSVYWEFGSGYTVGGFALQNRGSQFSLDPASANVLAPGKRPFHTIIPAFAMRDGEPWLSFGLMGGSMQPQGHAQVLINLIDFGMDLQEAGDFPRFRHAGSSQPTGTVMSDGGVVKLEASVPSAVRRGLEARGHRIEIAGPNTFGGYQAIARDPKTGLLTGATESRKDGLALGY
jgi:gamma-glutamyltranspeptidase / glutathione hydrolase